MIVLVHGVPETAAMWSQVQRLLDRPTVALELPGFGCPLPDGFQVTKDGYAAWLLGELDRIEEPVDLVGHDWGGGLAYRIATAHGDRIRSWVADIANLAHPDYEWHPIGKVWLTPGDGEALMEMQATLPPEQRAPLFEAMGVPPQYALEMAAASDATMSACILGLYRSAVPNAHADWGPWTPTQAPGMVLYPTADAFGDERMAAEVAASLGARFERLEGVNHFWPYEAPEQAVALLEDFWSSLD